MAWQTVLSDDDRVQSHPIVKLWEMQKQMARLASTIQKEQAGYADALEFLLRDIRLLRGRITQVGGRADGKEIILVG